MDLTSEQREKYVATGGVTCPFCGSQNLEGGPVEIDSNYAWQPVTCSGCDRSWDDLYTLTGIDERE